MAKRTLASTRPISIQFRTKGVSAASGLYASSSTVESKQNQNNRLQYTFCAPPTLLSSYRVLRTYKSGDTHTPRVVQSSEYKSTDGLCLKRCRNRPPLVSQQFFNRFHYGLVKCLTVSQSVIYTVSTCVVLLVAARPSG